MVIYVDTDARQVIMCYLCAVVQGMDETANNGAQYFYSKRFNIVSKEEGGCFTQQMTDNLTGLVIGAPYLACAILGCWLTAPLNSLFGHRGTIQISCFIAAIASVWEGLANSWSIYSFLAFSWALGSDQSRQIPLSTPLNVYQHLFEVLW